jgi:hypothetical protein
MRMEKKIMAILKKQTIPPQKTAEIPEKKIAMTSTMTVSRTLSFPDPVSGGRIEKAVGDALNISETLEVIDFKQPPAYVTIRKGMTVNVGNYESVRFDVEVTRPCYVEEVQDCYTLVDALTDQWTEEQYTSIKAGGN